MNNNSPTNQFVVTIDMPQGIRACYMILALGFDSAIPQHLAQLIDSSKRANHLEILNMNPILPQKPDNITNS